jgi:hypothetical protein
MIREEPGRHFTDILRWKRTLTLLCSPSYREDTDFDKSNGTMFRLPLKNDCIKRDSGLSDQAATLETIDRLFARLRPDLFDLAAVSELHPVDPSVGAHRQARQV